MSMNKKLLAGLCATLAVSSVSAGGCDATVGLLKATGMPAGLTDPATPTGTVSYCPNLVADKAEVCCTADTLNSLQKMSDTLGAAMLSDVAARDTYYGSIGDGANAMANALDGLKGAVTNYVNAIAGAAGAAVSDAELDAFQQVILGSLTTLFGEDPESIASSIADDYKDVTASLGQYQSSRTTCALEVLKTQAAVWCLACDPNAATNGVTVNPLDNTKPPAVALSDTACQRISDACYQYLVNSDLINLAINFQPLVLAMQALTEAINAAADDPAKAAAAIAGLNLGDLETEAALPKDTVVGAMPEGCTSAKDCDWMCGDFFNNGVFDTDLFVIGGAVALPINFFSGGFDSSDLDGLIDDTEDDTEDDTDAELNDDRRLGNANEYDPSDNEAGTEPTFEDDPAGINGSSSGVLGFGSVAISMMMVTGAMML